MAKIKGCTNSQCVAHTKKITYKKSEDFCSKCGQPLSFICKSCYTPIEESQRLCIMCQAKVDDRNDKIKDGVAKVGTAALSLGVAVLSKGKIPKK